MKNSSACVLIIWHVLASFKNYYEYCTSISSFIEKLSSYFSEYCKKKFKNEPIYLNFPQQFELGKSYYNLCLCTYTYSLELTF